ncbi:hypothetical protein [Micromonospora sp. CPCC 205556]|uniref:hypothetical protein n=1 Tax=Micromonospora sp. CPCC 205556 TaxID=3122398 RepID=UPI002FF43B85
MTLTLGAFGPYLAPGLRTEQVGVYGAVAALFLFGLWMRVRLTGTAQWVAAAHLTLIAVAASGVLLPPPNHTLYRPGSILAGLDNVLLPIAVVAVVGMLVGAGADPGRMLRAVCASVVWAMAGNALLAIHSAASDDTRVLAPFRLFGEAESVADRAEQLGRYSGIFNQPAEAGLVYSVAVLAALYLYQQHIGRLTVALLALTVGGVLSVSKVFLLVGVPVAIAYALLAPGRWRRLAAVGAATVAAHLVASRYLDQWEGQSFALRLLPGSSGSSDQVGVYTAGRFGGQSTLQDVVDIMFAISPTFGVGLGGLQMAYDNGWVEVLVMAGLFGVALHTALLAALLVGWAGVRNGRPESGLAGGLVLVVIGASFGLPALTANRCATAVWLLLGLLLLVRRDGSGGPWWQEAGSGRHRTLLPQGVPLRR